MRTIINKKHFTFYFYYLNRTHTVIRIVWKQSTLRWFIANHCLDRRLRSDWFVDLKQYNWWTNFFYILPPIQKSSDCLGTIRLCLWISHLQVLYYNQSSKTTEIEWIISFWLAILKYSKSIDSVYINGKSVKYKKILPVSLADCFKLKLNYKKYQHNCPQIK